MTHEPWLPGSFVAPNHIELPGPSTPHHLRPIHPDDTEVDMVAVMGSRERLWSIYGEAWGWPLSAPRYVGRDLSWTDWLSLPEL